jgi:CRP-like cAMP-binding protein
MSTGEGVRLGGFVALLGPDARAALLGLGRVRRYGRGATLLMQGARDDAVVVLLQGRVKVSLDTPDGREVVLAVLGPGDLVGEFEAIEPEATSRTASNIALEPVECRVFASGDLRRFLAAYPDAALELLRLTIRKLRTADQRRVDATALDAPHRLAHFLVERADAQLDPELDVALTPGGACQPHRVVPGVGGPSPRCFTRSRADRDGSAPDHHPGHAGPSRVRRLSWISPDPVVTSPSHYTVVFENDRVRVLDTPMNKADHRAARPFG